MRMWPQVVKLTISMNVSVNGCLYVLLWHRGDQSAVYLTTCPMAAGRGGCLWLHFHLASSKMASWPPDHRGGDEEEGRRAGVQVRIRLFWRQMWLVSNGTCFWLPVFNYSCLKFEICVIYGVVVNHQTGLDCLLLKEIILRYELVIVKDFSSYTDHDTDLFPGVLPDLWILLIVPNMCLDLHIMHFCCITRITVVFFF